MSNKGNLLITSLTVGVFVAFFIIFVMRSDQPKTEVKPLKTSGALQSLDLWHTQRAYPNKILPEQGFYKAFEYSKQNLTSASDNSSNPWQQLGPHNIGGRTLALAFNPFNGNTLYAGSASGGLWRTYTGGAGENEWSYVSTGFPVLGVGAIAISPSDSNTIYIGTGEVYAYQNSIGGMTVRTTRGSYGIGILKTTNSGATWSKVLDWTYNQQRGVQVVRINPRNPNTVWAGTTEGTYRSYNAGANWQLVDNTLMVTDLVVNPNDTGTVFIACGNLASPGNGLYRTTNSGSNWTKLTAGLPPSYGGKAILSIYNASPNVIFASIGNGAVDFSGTWLVKSVNNGNTWTTVSNQDYSTYQGWYSHAVGVNPVDSSKVITAGIDIWRSTAGGPGLVKKTNWSAWYLGRTPIGGPEGPPNYSHADHHAIVYHPTDPNIIYFGNDGGVFRSMDGGETYEGCNGGYQTSQFYNGFSSAATDSMFAMGGLQDNATAMYDGQFAWIRVIGGDGCWTAINSRNKDTVYGSSQYLNILRSSNRGNSFQGIPAPTGEAGFAGPYVLGKVNPSIMYVGRNIISRSTNAGNSWTNLNGGVSLDGNNLPLCLTTSPLNDNVIYVTTAPLTPPAKMFRSTNGGANWINITGSLPDRYLIDIAADPVSESVVYVTASGYGSGHVFRSVDYGQTWADITNGLPDLPTTSVAVDPLNNSILYVGNDLGVYSSTNAGASWQEFKTGMPDAAIVMDLSISKLNRKIRAATHGNGVFEANMLSPVIGISGNEPVVSQYKLYQNYPNPFNPSTTIRYDLARNGIVKLTIYDIAGREISVPINEFRGAGSYELQWNAGDLSSGVYYYKIQTGDFTEIKKMLLIK